VKAFFFSYLLVHRNFSVISFPPRACLLKSELSKFSTKLISRTKGSRRVPGKKKDKKFQDGNLFLLHLVSWQLAKNFANDFDI